MRPAPCPGMTHPYPPHCPSFSYVGVHAYALTFVTDQVELGVTVRYIVGNPVRAGLVVHPRDYPFLESQRFSVDQLLEWCAYSQDAL